MLGSMALFSGAAGLSFLVPGILSWDKKFVDGSA